MLLSHETRHMQGVLQLNYTDEMLRKEQVPEGRFSRNNLEMGESTLLT